jgi:hypothetical protein
VPVPPHAHRDATPGDTSGATSGATSGVEPHPVIAAALAAARTRNDLPTSHKAPLRPPSRRAWMAAGLLVTLTALPMLVVILAGRAGLHTPADLPPYRAGGGPPVVVEPGPGGANRDNDAAVAPDVAGPTPAGPAGAAGGSRAEATPCPTVSGSGGAQAAGGGAPPAGGGSSSGSGGDAPPVVAGPVVARSPVRRVRRVLPVLTPTVAHHAAAPATAGTAATPTAAVPPTMAAAMRPPAGTVATTRTTSRHPVAGRASRPPVATSSSVSSTNWASPCRSDLGLR